MKQASGLLSKISDSQYRLLTMDGELCLEGNLALSDGFHSNMDLSNVVVSQDKKRQLISSGTFALNKLTTAINDCDDCQSECACSPDPDDCSTPNDCDCECAPS